ncbi:DUF3800 domain-containing protein [Bordetella pseudohinzii]|uniref:DUF3800 domain-containing protein n=1 Tax=Bordetella pseudohinzii TaxID=1331258 RepID=A0ABM6DA79_9BORD|nr:DUF3800 domain-containing protein [Bordetella pseudohinzii]ANY14660.1 hypothetical protein BBN53_01390 [Bordetella pseudohinzii]KXA76646.1 hypothetical protein AW878_17645 [Bordetella pseudohinzii]KXA76763.1 hypothetical protein AW877_16110 [Bordetella pseudohinzii]
MGPAHYVVYLDEFGHIGPYVSRSHPRFRTSPVFGFAGFMLPAAELREFAIHFHQLKCRLLRPEIQRQHLPAWRWEKKGAQLFTERNLRRYPMLVQAATRLIDRIRQAGGHVVACGGAKPPGQTAADRFQFQLLAVLRRVAAYCEAREATFMVVLDQQKSGKRWRAAHVEACTRAMFEEGGRKCRSLMEPPLQAESDLFQTLQCADWICGLAGRLYAYRAAPADYPEWACFEQCFGRQLDAAVLPGLMPGG